MNKFFKTLAASVLGLALAAGVGVGVAGGVKTNEVKAASYSMTPNNATTGRTEKAYITDVVEFTDGNGIGWKIKQWNPATLQIKTNQAAGSEFSFCSTSPFPGNITKVVISFTGLALKDTSSTGMKLVPSTSDSSELVTTGGSDMTWNETKKTLTWEANSKDGYKSFSFYQNGKVATGNNYLASSDAIVVTYDSGEPTVDVTGVSLDTHSTTIYPTEEFDLTATVTPDDATNKNVSWTSSNEDVATVEDGHVKAIKVGTSKITVETEDGGFKDSCDVTVEDDGFNYDSLSNSIFPASSTSYVSFSDLAAVSSALYAGSTSKPSITDFGIRVDGNNTGIVTTRTGGLIKSITTSTSSESGASSKYSIYASDAPYESAADLFDLSKAGTQIVSSTHDSINFNLGEDYQYIGIRSTSGTMRFNSILIKWEPVKPTSIEADSEISLSLGESKQLEYELVNGDYIVSETEVEFESSSACVSVTEDGLITGEIGGSAMITITSKADPNVKKEIGVTVSESKIDVESVTLNVHELELKETHTEALTYTLLPTDASVKDVVWTSSDEEVATVDENGLVTAIKAGPATIKVESVDNPEKYDECEVTVVEREKVYFELVDDASKLVNGAQYVVTGVKDEVINVMGHYKTNDNNIKSAGQLFVDEDSHVYGVREDVESFYYTLNQDAEGYWTMFDGAKYLYAAGGTSNNYLKAKTDIGDTSKWDITFKDYGIDVAARGGVTNNNMRYNSGNDLFSCYGYNEGSEGSRTPKQSQITLYKVITSMDTAEGFAEYFLEDTNAICLTGTDNYEALNAKWATYAANYNALDDEEKAKFLVETPTAVIKNMLDRYDYVVVKYNLTPFIDGHVITLTNPYMSLVSNNNQTMMIVIISVAVASISLLGVTIFLKKRRAVR